MKRYLDDYYKGKIKTGELAELINVHPTQMVKYFEDRGMLTFNKHIQRLDFDNKKLSTVLRNKYNNIKNRCNGIAPNGRDHIYKGLEYLSIIEWVDFCNDHKDKLNTMWEKYAHSKNNLKYAISIDRIDNNKGYNINNLQFVSHGFNSWKRNLNRPIRAKRKDSNEWKYFMSCTEGGRFFRIRDRDFGEILRGVGYCNKDYDVELSDIKTVLNKNNCLSIENYYNEFIKRRVGDCEDI